MQLRKRLEAAETAKQEDAEKRNRKNRERKIKRRQKNRDMKAAAAGGTADGGDVAMADDASSDGDDCFAGAWNVTSHDTLKLALYAFVYTLYSFTNQQFGRGS